ncbi:P-loop containing nucleoside triphosphate hydrolase protein [Massarina eburnea CBS 473.64]|uniref:DNA 3'-5' helicase n=1 Tax=Massarina eburnea CBS 473.64 TaxID=1395130 RepID=A0A6A6S9G8_9PLEO|nr:P-loop containing nucleoside triphosphate hydrolase protein [Massarina eburnea CBS 473.64]
MRWYADWNIDERLLQQPLEDRVQLAEKGQARVSLGPLHPQPSYLPRDHDDELAYPQQPRFARDLGQFAYTATQPQESSSDLPIGVSSSPAFRAGQRRFENEYVNAAPAKDHTRVYEERDGYVTPEATQKRTEYSLLNAAQPNSYPGVHGDEERHFIQQERSHLPQPARPGAPIVQGIEILTPGVLPDRLRTIFPYKTFNAVQSKCFNHLYKSDNNFVLASPTGSGKTVILEFAICRAIATNATGQYKIVYQAPLKALCSERHRDWQQKFGPLGLNCVELTGDSDSADLKTVQSANIIVTTPEKWDSVTRKWNDHDKLLRLIKLFLIDEVHLLKEDRGATLEAVVSRMKSIGTDVRFVALSATIPNFDDVATWLGRNPAEPYISAMKEKFGEEFRPVKLRKHVCGYASNANDFAFEKTIDGHLLDVVRKYSERKPIMIFCCTRKSTVGTAKMLANWWSTRTPKDRLWNAPAIAPTFRDRELRECTASGVAFHHAGVESECRIAIEKAFLNNEIGVICCTSTLAVGVNLPCHMVIIKNTMRYENNVLQEYSDIEIMQMLGRAGRPQFENSAVAVIMTRQTKVHKYEKMVTGEEVLESTLHLNLVDHLNAEIVLGTIRDFQSARKWFASTFLYVRLKQNPTHYKLDGARSGQSVDEQLDDICFRDITLLRECELAEGEDFFRCTEFGHIMARYYIHFDSMRVFMGLQPKASISEILSAIAQASEFHNIRFRQGEKALYKLINKSPCTRFPIPVDLALPAHKVSLLIQSILGAMDIPWDGELSKHKIQYNTEANVAFRALSRLIRCIIDCQIHRRDSISINNALILERSVAARVWDDSPSQIKQIEGIGVVGIRKLVTAGIRSVEELECIDPQRIEFILNRNPPFGQNIIEKLKSFPKLRVSLSLQPNSTTKTPEGVKVMVKTDIGFINEKVPMSFGSKLVYVCMLAETSDGRMAHFARVSARTLGKGQQQTLPVLLTSPGLSINCYLMCDGIAGTQRTASVTPKIPSSMFPPKPLESAISHRSDVPTRNISRRLSDKRSIKKASATNDEFGDDGIDDEELVKVAISDQDFIDIDNYVHPTDVLTRHKTSKNTSSKSLDRVKPAAQSHEDDSKQLENGKWACNHLCKNKQTCKHLCCKTGMDKPPKKTGPKRVPSIDDRTQHTAKATERPKSTQTKLQLSSAKRKNSFMVEEIDLTEQETKKKSALASSGPREYRDLHKLHKGIHKGQLPSSVSSVMHTKPEYCYGVGGNHNLSFMDGRSGSLSSDYGNIEVEDLTDIVQPQRNRSPDVSHHFQNERNADSLVVGDDTSDTFGDDGSIFGDAMIGIADSQDFQVARNAEGSDEDMRLFENSATSNDRDFGLPDSDYDGEISKADNGLTGLMEDARLPTENTAPMGPPPKKRYAVFLDSTSSPQPPQEVFASAKLKPKPKDATLKESKIVNRNLHTSQRRVSEEKTLNKKAKADLRDMEYDELFSRDDLMVLDEEAKVEERQSTPEAYKGLEPWLFREFGGCVEIVDE